jgi:CDP-glucose 4,6-dehydratase
VTVLELVGVIQDLMKARHLEPDVQNNASGEIREQYLDAKKAHRILGWQPQFTLEQGLNETIEWYKNYLAKHKE